MIAMLLESYSARTVMAGVISLAISLFFTVANLVSSVMYRSVWYAVQTGYYASLVLYRGTIIPIAALAVRKHADDAEGLRRAKLKIQLSGGAFLVIVTLAMCMASWYLVVSGRPQEGNFVTAIATATYTFWKITSGIIHFFRAGKNREIIASMLRKLNLCDACMSMMSLTVLMISVFSEESGSSWELFVEAPVCFAGCALALGISAHMIITSVRALGMDRPSGGGSRKEGGAAPGNGENLKKEKRSASGGTEEGNP